MDLARVLKNQTVGDEDEGDMNCSWCAWNGTQRFGKGLVELEMGARIVTIQTTALSRSVRILRRHEEIWCHSDFSERPTANSDVKNLQGIE